MPNPPNLLRLFTSLAILLIALTACAPDLLTNGGTRVIPLTDSIRNLSVGYYRAYWEIEDTARWEAVLARADTIVPYAETEDDTRLKLRSEKIWYAAKMVNGGLRSRQHYPGWKRGFDSISRDQNIMYLNNHQSIRVSIPAADVVLGRDSLRIALVHANGPAYDWNFHDYEPVPDRLLLTTYGNDTMPIVTDMACIGQISRQTVFRVGKQHYAIKSIADDYGSIEIEALDDARGLPLTAELDLNYKAVPVKDLAGRDTTIRRTPGRDLILYFWAGFRGDKQLRGLDSLYQQLPEARKGEIDIAVISRFSSGEDLKETVEKLNFKLPIYLGSETTCLRLNCVPHVPYLVTVNGRGRIVSFHDWSPVLKDRLIEMAEVPEAQDIGLTN